MKLVIDPVKYGVSAKHVERTSPARLRNPAIKVINHTGAAKQYLERDELDSMAGMGDWWDSLTDTISETATKAWDSAVTSGQAAAVKLVQQQMVKIIGADGRPKEVPAGSPEAVAAQTALNQQAAIAQSGGQTSDPTYDKMMKMMMWGMGGVGVLLVGTLIYKVVKK